MHFRPKILLVLLLFSILIIFSCTNKEEYPVVPEIQFVSFVINQNAKGIDSIGVLTISFTDGDGDIGLTQSDTTTDFFINFLKKQNGILKQAYNDQNLPINFNSRIPDVTPEGKNKNIKGEISIDMDLFSYIHNLTKADTIAFQIYIKDRALNKSNVIITPETIITPF
jgi:hypothetical protein